jgi:predicted TIM-barrel fold metal-dependent hydrolase
MIIDCHAHIHTAQDAELGRVLSMADRSGIEKIVVSCLGRPERGWMEFPTAELLEESTADASAAVEKHPDRFIGQVYLSADHVEKSLELIDRGILNGPCSSIKLWISQLADDPRLDPIYERAIEHDIPILQHTWFKATGNGAKESNCYHVVNAVKQHPKLKVWIAHASGRWEEAAQIIRDYPSIRMDISGGEPESGIVDCLVKHIGPERVFYGADIPGRSFAVQMTKVLSAGIPEEQKLMILGENFRRWANV